MDRESQFRLASPGGGVASTRLAGCGSRPGTRIGAASGAAILRRRHSGVAQLAEQRTVNPFVVGSSPTPGAHTAQGIAALAGAENRFQVTTRVMMLAGLVPVAAAKQGQNRTAGVTQVGPGKWKVRAYAGLDRDGRQRQATRVVRGTQAQAIRARRALQVVIEQSRTDSGAPGSFAELAERWYRMGRTGWSPSTAHGYRAHLDNHLIAVLGSIPADRLKPKDLDGLHLSLAEGRRTTRPMRAASVESAGRRHRRHARGLPGPDC
jgi:Phage integrase, N-terminal SAM-like domain